MNSDKTHKGATGSITNAFISGFTESISIAGSFSQMDVTDSYLEDAQVGVSLKGYSGKISIKRNRGNNIKTFVSVVRESNVVKTSPTTDEKNVNFTEFFNKTILELHNLEAQEKILNNLKKVKLIRYIKANLGTEKSLKLLSHLNQNTEQVPQLD